MTLRFSSRNFFHLYLIIIGLLMTQRMPFRPSSTIQLQKYDYKSNGSPQQQTEANSFTNKHSFQTAHNHTPNQHQQQPNRIVGTEIARLRTTINPKTPEGRNIQTELGIEIDRVDKSNNFLCKTIGAQSGAALKDKLIKQLNNIQSNVGLVTQTTDVSTLQRNAQMSRINTVKSPPNRLDNAASFQQYDKLNQQINRNKQMIEQLRRNTRKDETKEKKNSQSPTLVGLENKKQCARTNVPKHSDGVNNSNKFLTASMDNMTSSPLLRKRTAQHSRTPPNCVNSINDNKTRQMIALSKNQRDGISIDQFVMGKKLGEGKFGVVHLALHRATHGLFAIKRIAKSKIRTSKMIDQYAQQIRLQSSLRHGNILPMYGFFADKTHLYMVLEYMEGGTLFSKLKNQIKLTEKQTAQVVRQIARAVEYLHDRGIAHRDIKPENIVIADDVCRLCDFGWAVLCTDRRKTYCGTFDYVAPQILQGIEYDMSVDLWCLGVLTFELLTGRAPFYDVSKRETMRKIINVENEDLQYPAGLSEIGRDFLDKLLRKDPEERIKATAALQHPFLVQFCQN